MKHLFYIVVIFATAILAAVYFQNYEALSGKTAKISQETTTPAQEEQPKKAENKNCVCKSECLCQEDETDCDCSETKSTCSCTDENGKTVTLESIETNNSNIEELNPEETSEEEETILEE